MIDLNQDNDSDEASKDDCLLYLLGELDSEQTKRFERRLASSPRLETEILRQAEILSSLSEISLPMKSPSVAPTTPTSTRWKTTASLLAVAACIAAAIVGWWPRESTYQNLTDQNLAFSTVENMAPEVSQNAVSEVTLIARAWANDALAFSGEDFADLESADRTGDDDTYDVADDANDDSTLSWIYIAVSTITEGETDEG